MTPSLVYSDTKTLADAYSLYTAYLRSNGSESLVAQTKTAIIRYTLPGWGFEINEQAKLSPETIALCMKFMAEVPLQDFSNALNIQQKVYDALGDKITGASKRNYRCALKRMLDWCSNQQWWKKATGSTSGEYAPRMMLGRNLTSDPVRVTNRKRKPFYSLRTAEMSQSLQNELNSFYKFLTDISWPVRQEQPLRPVTAEIHIEVVGSVLGWLHRVKRVPIEELSFHSIINFVTLGNQSAAMDTAKCNLKLCLEYLSWLRKEREVHPLTELKHLSSLVAIAKYLYCDATNYPTIKRYQDVPIIVLLHNEIDKTRARAKTSPSAKDVDKKWLEWEDFLACVKQLKAECADTLVCGVKRHDTAIAKSYQRYLVFAFLAYMPPDRQRTLRELEVGRTLVKQNNSWHIHLLPEDYKTGKSYGEFWQYVPEIIYPELEAWLNKWRATLKPNHNFVFTQVNGQPFKSNILAHMFKRAAYRLTGQVLTPHLVRDMAVTYFQRQGATDAEMESLALAMHHSREMQRKVYDRRTQQEKTSPANDMMLRAEDRDRFKKQYQLIKVLPSRWLQPPLCWG